jgi:Zn-dependent protease
LPEIALFGLYMVVFLFSLSIHEAAHAWTAERFGDSTGRYLGRITLNPLSHIDVLGTLIFPAIGFFTGGPMFGWAKPVPWNPLHVKDRRKADIWISAAGPISNVLVLVGFVVLLKIFQAYFASGADIRGTSLEPLYRMCLIGAQLNITLAVFNMIPIPPLDGSWILPHLLPYDLARGYEALRPYGFLILLICMYMGIFSFVLAPFWRMLQVII